MTCSDSIFWWFGGKLHNDFSCPNEVPLCNTEYPKPRHSLIFCADINTSKICAICDVISLKYIPYTLSIYFSSPTSYGYLVQTQVSLCGENTTYKSPTGDEAQKHFTWLKKGSGHSWPNFCLILWGVTLFFFAFFFICVLAHSLGRDALSWPRPQLQGCTSLKLVVQIKMLPNTITKSLQLCV